MPVGLFWVDQTGMPNTGTTASHAAGRPGIVEASQYQYGRGSTECCRDTTDGLKDATQIMSRGNV